MDTPGEKAAYNMLIRTLKTYCVGHTLPFYCCGIDLIHIFVLKFTVSLDSLTSASVTVTLFGSDNHADKSE